MLAYFCKKGLIERLGPGVYRSVKFHMTTDVQWEGLALAAATVPNGIICLISALCYHDLTDHIMREYWIAVPHGQWPARRKHVRIVRMRNTTLGLKIIKINQHRVRIFNKERVVIDAFRFLDPETAIKSLQNYLHPSKSYKPDLIKLSNYAKKLRVNIRPYLAALTT